MRWIDRLIQPAAPAEIDAEAQMAAAYAALEAGDHEYALDKGAPLVHAAVARAQTHHLSAGVSRDAVRAYKLLQAARARGGARAEPFVEAARKASPDNQATEIEGGASTQDAEPVA